MAVYLVAQLQIQDRTEYSRYEAGFLDVFAKFGGEILAVDDAVDCIEGEWPYSRTVLLRFPDADEARRWYDSPEYQALVQHRFRAANTNIAMVQGF